ncbi:MAG: hypothetical protein Q7R43_03870 [Candidatus Daviesbacteria bacterium]|nr:hypothetical protein [Candidatus Daviesbacteria bacterium]
MIKPQVLNQTNNRLMINLLPSEVILSRKQYSKFSMVSKISAAALIILVFFTSTTLALRFSQTFEQKKVEEGLVMAESKVSDLKGKEGQVIALKQRLDSISSILGNDTKRKAIFNMVVFLIPPDMQVLEVNVDKSGNMSVTLSSASLSSIQTLFDNLGNKEKNSDLISKVDLDGISLGRDSVYRFSLKITPKK